MADVRRPAGMTDEEHLAHSKAAFLYYFEKNGGNVSRTVRSVKLSRKFKGAAASRSSYYRWCKDDSAFAAACDDVDESNLDEAESCIMDAIADGDTSAARFLLKTKGKKRGYVERTEVTGADGMPHRIEIVSTASAPPVQSEDDIVDVDEIVIPSGDE